MSEFDKVSANQLIYSLIRAHEKHPVAVFRHAIRKVSKLYDIPDPYRPDGSPVVFTSTIVKVVSEHFGMSPEDLISDKRSIIYMTPRHIIYYLCVLLSGQSKVQIGKKLGNRDHSTIIHGQRKILKRIQESEQLETLIDTLIEKCIDAAHEEKQRNFQRMTQWTLSNEKQIS